MAKQKNAQKSNPRKVMQQQIDEIGGATSAIIGELRGVNNHLVGLEALVLNLAEYLGKKDGFEKFIQDKLAELEKEREKMASKKVKKIK